MYEDVFEETRYKIAPEEYAELMFRQTGDDGILYIPDFNDVMLIGREPGSLRCKMEWTEADLRSALDEFRYLYSKIEAVAPDYELFRDDIEEAREKLDRETFDVWDTYIKLFDLGEFDEEQIRDIADRIEDSDDIKRISADIAAGRTVPADDMEHYIDIIDTKLSPEELKLYDDYMDTLRRQCEERVGDGPCAFQEVIRANRVCRLIGLGAPKVIVDNEAAMLLTAMILHRFCVAMEKVDNAARLRANAMVRMSDDELDELFRPQKMNSRKSMAPLFVFLILQTKSGPERHLRQQDILSELAKFPYEIIIERKALSRIIHNLADSQVGVCSDARSGAWYDAAEDHFRR